jgi:hypothetical protein
MEITSVNLILIVANDDVVVINAEQNKITLFCQVSWWSRAANPPLPLMVDGKDVVVCRNGVETFLKMNCATLSPELIVIGVVPLSLISILISPQ